MIKLLYITNLIYGSGGLERVLSIKASYLADKLGYEVHIVTLNQGNHPLFYKFSEHLHYHDISATGKLNYFNSYFKGIRRIICEINPNVISVCDDGLKGTLFPLLFGTKIPVIYERHVSKEIEHFGIIDLKSKVIYAIKNVLMNQAIRFFDRLILLTEGNRVEWNSNNLEVISNPLSFFPEDLSTLENKEVIVVGKFSVQKGQDLLLETWRKVHQKFPDWKLKMYGKGDLENLLITKIENYNLSNSVSLYPPTTDILSCYQQSSIYIMSSRFEGFGMVLIEAMACGVPCVSFDCPCGPADVIGNAEDGFLVPAEDVDALAEKLMVLMSNEALRKQMGAKARENVKRFLPEKIIPQWDVLFKELTRNKSKE